MQITKGKRTGKKIEIKEIPVSDMMLLPPREDVCQECACDHDPRFPHNPESLYYQMKFHMENGRRSTWADALAHCSNEVKSIWVEELQKHGIEV